MKQYKLNGKQIPQFEASCMEDALSKMIVNENEAVSLNSICLALCASKKYGTYFSTYNFRGFRATVSRWLRQGVFEDFTLVQGKGVMRKSKEIRSMPGLMKVSKACAEMQPAYHMQ